MKKRMRFEPPEHVAIPRSYGTAPIFVPEVQTEPRSVTLPNGNRWTVGVTSRLKTSASSPAAIQYQRGFDVRHAQVIFGLLSFYHQNILPYGENVNLSFRDLIKISGLKFGTPQLDLVKTVLDDLSNTWTQIERPDGIKITFRVLGSLAIEEDLKKNTEKIKYIVFDKTFISFMEEFQEYIGFRFDVWSNMTSKTAKAIYLYLPSRALAHTADKPFKITLKNLYAQLNLKSPAHKSKRLQNFTESKNSAFNQLNNAPLHGSKRLKLSIAETSDGKDFNLCSWVEVDHDSHDLGGNTLENSLMVWWQCGGGSVTDYVKRIKKPLVLNPYEVQKLDDSGININSNRKFLTMAKSLLGEAEFSLVCGEFHLIVESGKSLKPFPYFAGMIRNALSREVFQPKLEF